MTVERLSELAAAAGVQRLAADRHQQHHRRARLRARVPQPRHHPGGRDRVPRTATTLLYIGIARNNEGFRELNEFLTHHNVTGEPLPPQPPSFPNAYVIYPSAATVRRQALLPDRSGVDPDRR
ncbi:MAG: hypothetical protein MZV63_22590 [Marinilabiliales bacterium]|nr:hypothetical protein [Marinilabiliales bacterium]